MSETLIISGAGLLGVVLGAALVGFIWWFDRRTLEKLFLAELKSGRDTRDELLRMLRSAQQKLASKDIGTLAQMVALDQENGSQHYVHQRDDATEALIAGTRH